jgi:thymidylate synthase
MSEKGWPVYERDMLAIGDPNSSVGLCTLWTPKEKVLQFVGNQNYNVAGQCYSAEGISLLIRNILANKRIEHLVLYGTDLSHTGEAMVALKEQGLLWDNECLGARFNNTNRPHKIKGFPNFEIDAEIPVEAIERFRENVTIHDKKNKIDHRSLDDYLRSACFKTRFHGKPWGDPETYARSLPVEPESFPSEGTGFVVRGKYVADTWLKILDTITRFGFIKQSQYGEKQQEITVLTSIVTDEDPNNFQMPDPNFFLFSSEHLQEYLPQLMSKEAPEGVKYTYGSRLRNHNGIDQIASMINELKGAKFSRRAVGITWNVETDYNNPNSPCVDLVQALIQDKLHFTVYIRSNDMYKAWPENALALRRVQGEIADAVSAPLGDLIIVSDSAHIYERDWNAAKELLEKHRPYIRKYKQPDSRGNVLLEVEDGKIKVTHLSPEGKRIGEFYALDARDAYREISARQMISQINHALDIGTELGKAEVARNLGITYVQDKPISKK